MRLLRVAQCHANDQDVLTNLTSVIETLELEVCSHENTSWGSHRDISKATTIKVERSAYQTFRYVCAALHLSKMGCSELAAATNVVLHLVRPNPILIQAQQEDKKLELEY